MTEQNAGDANKIFIGKVVGGGLKETLQVRLDIPAKEVQEGAFVVIEDDDWQFYGLITDLYLGATDPRFADEPIGDRIPKYLANQLYGQTLFNQRTSTTFINVRTPSYGCKRT